MDAATWRFLLTVLAVGVVAILAGVAWTRQREASRREALLAGRAWVGPGAPEDEAGQGEVRMLLASPPLLAVGAPAALHTDADQGWCVLRDPAVAVLPEGAGSVRELLALVERAGGRPLVLLAQDVPSETVHTLTATWGTGGQQVLTLVAGPDECARAAATTGAPALSRADLQAGWVPALGHVRLWVSTATASWAA